MNWFKSNKTSRKVPQPNLSKSKKIDNTLSLSNNIYNVKNCFEKNGFQIGIFFII